jgi:hypothetical protein
MDAASRALRLRGFFALCVFIAPMRMDEPCGWLIESMICEELCFNRGRDKGLDVPSSEDAPVPALFESRVSGISGSV